MLKIGIPLILFLTGMILYLSVLKSGHLFFIKEKLDICTLKIWYGGLQLFLASNILISFLSILKNGSDICQSELTLISIISLMASQATIILTNAKIITDPYFLVGTFIIITILFILFLVDTILHPLSPNISKIEIGAL